MLLLDGFPIGRKSSQLNVLWFLVYASCKQMKCFSTNFSIRDIGLLFMEQILEPSSGLQEPCWSRAVYKKRIIPTQLFFERDWKVESLSLCLEDLCRRTGSFDSLVQLDLKWEYTESNLEGFPVPHSYLQLRFCKAFQR